MRNLSIRVSILLLFSLLGCRNSIKDVNELDSRISVLEEKIKDYYGRRLRDSMIIAANELLPLLEADSLAVRRGRILVQKGMAFDILGYYDSASYYLYEGLRIGEAENNPSLTSTALCNIGILYFNLGKCEEAIAAYEWWLEIARRQNDSLEISKALNNIGNAYMTLDLNLAKAIPYLQEGMEISKSIGYLDGRFTAALNMAQCFIELNRLDEAQQITAEVRENMKGNYYVDFTQAQIYRKTKEYDKAIAILEEMMKINVNTRELYLVIINDLAQIHEEKGDLRRALDYRVKYQADRDTLHTVEREKIIQEMKIAYNTEKKETQIAALAEEKRLFLILMIAGCVLALLILAILLYKNRLHRRHEQLLAAQVALDSETAERSRLAKDLHDGLGGMLSLVKINLNDVKGLKVMGREDAGHFDKALDMLDNSITELRRVAHHIMPESLIKNGLKTSLEDFATAVPGSGFHFYGEEKRLDGDLEVVLYRSAHELVNNVLKHAEAAHINIQLVQELGRISLTVADDGKGFDVNRNTDGVGLKNIKNRITVYGGEMHIFSDNKSGTEVNIEIPLKK